MRFTVFWSETLNQNVTLRLTVVMLSVVCLFLGCSLVRLAIRDPLIVERGCASTSAKLGSTKHSTEEIEAFVRYALPKRFDSRSSDAQTILSPEEHSFRLKEQAELKSRGLAQRLVVNEVMIEGTTAKVETDRLLTAGALRSALAFPLTLEFLQTDRTSANPYGLIISRVAPTKTKEESK